jgi:hypothetical protein
MLKSCGSNTADGDNDFKSGIGIEYALFVLVVFPPPRPEKKKGQKENQYINQ